MEIDQASELVIQQLFSIPFFTHKAEPPYDRKRLLKSSHSSVLPPTDDFLKIPTISLPNPISPSIL